MTSESPRGPLPAERRAHLLDVLDRDGVVRVADLTTELDVTAVTVRRDIARLEREGRLTRVHGGAVTSGPGPASRLTDRGSDDDGAPTRRTVPHAATIGVLAPSLDYYWPGVVRGMEAEARRHGLRIMLRGSSYHTADERPALRHLVEVDGVRGLICAPRMDSPTAGDVVDWLAVSGVPHVLVEREATHGPYRAPLEAVVSDHAAGALVAVHHLAGLGHRRVGLVLSRESPTSRKIAAGWRAACHELGLKHFERLAPDRNRPEFSNVVDEVVDTALTSGVTGLLVHSDPEASGVAQRAMDRGLSVPGDLSIVAYDDEVANLFSPAMTAVRPPRDAVGHAAVDLLVKRLADPARPGHRTAISPRLMVRESTGPVRR
ncbi:substrate-binding domain-containing protein [Isoptericola halotolerans]|uniref:substrate-binding domain-containing protein n=1 Tax=Isoptericola halotolerans TaxID=300560 RepID=UPI00388FD151